MPSLKPPRVDRPEPTDHAFVFVDDEELQDVEWLLKAFRTGKTVKVSVDDLPQMPLPTVVQVAFHRLLTYLAIGRGVAIEDVGKLLTLQQAADLLRVQRSHVVRLLDTGQLKDGPSDGSHQRVWLADLIDYQRRLAASVSR